MLSPFLFIIVMESLHVSIETLHELHYFLGISLPCNGITISHLMYVDDVIFIGKWSEINITNLNRLLRCFFLNYGLKMNLHKNKVFSVNVNDQAVDRIASILKCEPASLLFTYLGLLVGVNMNLSKHWSHIINRFCDKLSK